MQGTIERYQKHAKDNQTNDKSSSSEQNMQHLKQEATSMMKQIELLEVSKRKLLGEGLGSCTLAELQEIEDQLEKSVYNVRARKSQVFKEQIEQLREKEKLLTAENTRLVEKYGSFKKTLHERREKTPYNESSTSSDVETELFIGLPESRARR
ncbi:hypothetical protein ACFX13_028242 [Malus domestica]